MTISDFMTLFEKLGPFDLREADSQHADLVVENDQLDAWINLLDQHLGSPLKKTGEAVNFDAKKLTKAFGGIQKNQTLYVKSYETHHLMAMLWPWQNNRHTTLKLFHITVEEMDKMQKPGLFSTSN